MRTPLWWVVRGVGAMSAAAIAAAGIVYAATESRLGHTYTVPAEEIAVPSDANSLARGRHLVRVIGQCPACHGDDLAGQVMADDLWLGRLVATNLTPGRGGLDGQTTGDLVRSIRHGVKRDGRSVVLMPSQYLRGLSDTDLGTIIAYLRQLPPVDREAPASRAGPLTRLVMFLGKAPDLLAAEAIARRGGAPAMTSPGATAEYGAYLVEVAGCKVCHHENLAGGAHPLALPGEPLPSDLTPAGLLGHWSEQDFFRALRTGETPDGRRLDDRFMPWRAIAGMGDLELRAIWLYLRSLPPPKQVRG
ncbi:MAG: c-type cytochrome [Myxococcota bacterium]